MWTPALGRLLLISKILKQVFSKCLEDFMNFSGFEYYCETPGVGLSGKGKSYENAIQYYCYIQQKGFP